MKKPIVIWLLLVLPVLSIAQKARDWMGGINMDLVKSDYNGFFTRAQVGLEFNYFLSSKFTATAGVETWTRAKSSAVIGTRWYPTREAYIRARGLAGANLLSIGGGWLKPMSENLQFEAMTDLYSNGYFSIRAGFAYFFRKGNQ
jgi:hypothetical protein